jgi:hypothetical protein
MVDEALQSRRPVDARDGPALDSAAMQRRSRLLRLFLVLSAFVPLVALFDRPPQTQALVWTAFVAVWLLAPAPREGRLRFLAAALLTGLGVELAAWGGHYFACNPSPALFHPQLGPNLLIGIGFYLGLGLAWLWLIRRFGFSATEAFVVNGTMGVFLEQRGAAFLAGLHALPLGLLLWLFVFLIYGPMAAIPRRLALPPDMATPPRRLWHYPVAGLCAYLAALGGTYAFALIYLALHVLPDHQPICAAPFW